MAKKKQIPEPEVNVKDRFRNVKILVETGRPKEAIAYIYLIYTDVVHKKHNKPRLAHQTIREYAITCVNELNQSPDKVYPLVSKIEDIIYGGMEPTINELNQTIQLFSTLYNEVTGKTFSYSL